MNQTAQFLGEVEGWRDATILFDDVHGLWGGWQIRVGGDGRVVAVGVPPSAPQSRIQKRIAPDQAHLLFALCIEYDLLAIRFPPRASHLPDESYTKVTLINGVAECHTVGYWSNDPKDAGFDPICTALRLLT